MRFHRRPAYPVSLFAVITLAVIALSTAFLLWDLRKRELEHARLETVGITRIFLEQTERNFESADLVLKGVQDRLQTSLGSQFPLDGLAIHLLLGTRVLEMRQLDALYLVDPDGWIVNSSLEPAVGRISVAGSNYFKAFAGGADAGLFIDKPVRNAAARSWTLYLARKISGPDGKLRGVVVGAIDTAHFEDIYKFLKLTYVRPVSLYLADGTLIASVPHRENMIGERAPEFGPESLPPRGQDLRFASHLKGDGSREAFTLGRVPKYPLLVSVTNDEDEALASWRETAVPIVLVATIVSMFIIAAAAFLIRELTREQNLARALGEANDRYYQTVDSVMDAIVAIDQYQNIALFNRAAERMFGRAAQEVMGQPVTLLMPPHLARAHQGHVRGFMASGTGSRTMAPMLEITGLRADGSQFPVESTISQTLIDGRRQLTAVLRDVTERRRAEREMHEMNRQLRGLSASLQNIREQERTRIARELHDELGQQLTGLKLELSWLGGRIKDGRPPAADRVDEMRHMLDAAVASVRRLSSELRPLILDDLGFGEAVAWQSGEFAKRTGLQVSLDLQAVERVNAERARSGELPTVLFRIVQESLTNIARHARAENVEIHLIDDGRNLVLTVSDDGQGMADGREPGGFGLVSMRERAASLGGNFAIISGVGLGTTIQVELSLALPIFAGATA